MDQHPDKNLPFAWLCRRCRLHAEQDLSSRESATADAQRHSNDCHPGQPARYVVVQQFARCQWRRWLLARICGQPASWAHAPTTRIHLCEAHRAEPT